MTATAYDPAFEELTRERPRRDVVALGGLTMLVLGFVLNLFPWTPFWGTVVYGTLGTGLAVAILRWHYHGHIRLNIHSAFILGAVLQYLFAPMITRVITLDYSVAYTTTLEREQALVFYPQAMLITWVFLGVYFLFLGGMPLVGARRLRDGTLESMFTNRSHLVIAVLTLQLWLVRSYLVASGTFYHSNRSDFQLTNPLASGWGQFSGGVGPVVIAYLWSFVFLRRQGYLPAVIYTAIDVGFNFISGAREPTVTPIIVLFVTYVVVKNKVPWKGLLVGGIAGSLLMGFMAFYREAIAGGVDSNRAINFVEVRRAIDAALYKSEDKGGKLSSLLIGFSRIDDLQPIARIYQGVPEEMDYLSGETYERIPIAFVPRQFWPDKPPTVMAINEWFYRGEGGSSPTTVMGEGYLNFGWVGVALAAFVTLIAITFTERFMLLFVHNIAALPVYIAAIGVFARLHTQPLAVILTSFPKLCLLAILIHLFTRPSTQQTLQPLGATAH